MLQFLNWYVYLLQQYLTYLVFGFSLQHVGYQDNIHIYVENYHVFTEIDNIDILHVVEKNHKLNTLNSFEIYNHAPVAQILII